LRASLETKQQKTKEINIMAKFVCTHTMKGITRDQFSQVAAAAQQDPTVKGIQSFANLTEGKIYCVWQAPNPEAVTAWFKKMNVPYDSITKVEVEAAGGAIQTA
jgi:Nickel responsive protein SCO4226-like